jgi:hypothetical protein
MAKRARKHPTRRRRVPGPPRGSDDGYARRKGAPASRLLDDLASFSSLLDPAHPLGRLNTLLLMQGLEWQSAALGLYRRAFLEGSFEAPIEDRLRSVARTMMGMYLELVKAIPERREQLIAQHSDLAQAFSDALESLRQRLGEPGDQPPRDPDRQPRGTDQRPGKQGGGHGSGRASGTGG